MTKTWQTWRWGLLVWWGVVATMLLLIPDYQQQISHYALNQLYYPDTIAYTLLLITFYALLPAVYWVLSWVAWLRKHFIVKWLMMMPVHLVMMILVGMGAMHNSSVAFFLLLWTVLIGGVIHVVIVPLIWWQLPRE